MINMISVKPCHHETTKHIFMLLCSASCHNVMFCVSVFCVRCFMFHFYGCAFLCFYVFMFHVLCIILLFLVFIVSWFRFLRYYAFTFPCSREWLSTFLCADILMSLCCDFIFMVYVFVV